MSGLACPKCRAVVAGADAAETAWVLCPHCGNVIDTTAKEPEAPDKPKEPPAFKRSSPPPRRTRSMEWRVFRLALLIVVVLALFASVGYGAWRYSVYTPSFTEYSAPNGEFSIAFPGKPKWDNSGPYGSVNRRYGTETTEGYDAYIRQLEFKLEDLAPVDLEKFALWRVQDRGSDHPKEKKTPARTVKVPVGLATEFESWDWPRQHWVSTRIILIGNREVLLSVFGPEVRLNDRRVQKFFDSFRYREQ